LHKEDHENLWSHLKEKVGDVEEKIRTAGNAFLEKLHKDIKAV
jgi:hypothetical protein